MGADMRTNTEGLGDVLFTLRAFLRGVMRRYGDHLSASTFSLAFQVPAEHPPGCIGDGKGQTMVTDHVGRFQVLYDDGLIAIDVATGGFLQRVFALVGDALVDAGNPPFRFFAAGAALFALCQLPLSACQRTSRQ